MRTTAQPRRQAPIREVLRQFVESFSRNQPLDLAAQLAYYALLSIFPFAMFMLTVVGYLPLHGLDQHILNAVWSVMPPQAATLCEQTLNEIIGKQRRGLLTISLVLSIWTASGGISGLITALNRAYDVAETRPWWQVKLRALGVTIGGVLAIIVATAAMLIGPDVVRRIWAFFGFGGAFDRLWMVLRWPVAALALMTLLACMYYFLPNVRQKWRFITPGSVMAVLAWVAASIGFRIYVSHFSAYAKTYGALGAVVILLVWLWLSSLMVILGGELNAILDRVEKGIRHVEEEPGPAKVHDPRPVVPENRPQPPPREVPV
jgi:membrane protein